MAKLPLIISAPHASSKIPKKWRKRMQLSEEQIWHFSDPFTEKTVRHPRAFSFHIAKHHRALGDLNRVPTPESAFRSRDFHHGHKIWKKGKELTVLEQTELLHKNWFPYYDEIFAKMKKLIDNGAKRILFVDHHNTAFDHPAGGRQEYMPAIVISNLGSCNIGGRVSSRGDVSIPAAALKFFQKALFEEVGLMAEINQVYHGGYSIRWVTENAKKIDPKVKVFGVQFEYNLGLIHNTLSKKNDLVAMEILRKKVNRAIVQLVKHLRCDKC